MTTKIAIQKSGRLYEASLNFLASKGLVIENPDNKLVVFSKNKEAEIFFIRDDDIPEYVRYGVVDYGIVGRNLLAEKDIELPIIQELDFGFCELILAVPENSPVQRTEDLEGARIATSYSKFLSKYLKERNIRTSIISIQGSVEITPRLNMADAICDLTQTGKTLRENGLRIIESILKSQAILIGRNSKALTF